MYFEAKIYDFPVSAMSAKDYKIFLLSLVKNFLLVSSLNDNVELLMFTVELLCVKILVRCGTC